MSVAAAVPRGQPSLPLDASLVWACSFPSPQAPISAATATTPTPRAIASAAASPLPVQLPGIVDEESLCDGAVGHGCGFDSEPGSLRFGGSCPLQQQHQEAPWDPDNDSKPALGGCRCGGECRSAPVDGDSGRGGDGDEGDGRDGKANGDAVRGNGDDCHAARRQAHRHASTSGGPAAVAASTAHRNGQCRSSSTGAANATANGAVTAAAVLTAALSRRGSQAGADGGVFAPALTAAILPPSSPQPQPPIPLPSSRSNSSGGGGGGRVSGSGGGSGGAAAAGAAAARRLGYGVKASAMTSQISAAQRHRAATLIQAAWRGFRIRRLYLRLIVWRLRPRTRQQHQHQLDTYCGIREFPPIPDLPAVSLFAQYGKPYRFRSVKRRVWYGMEGPFYRQQSAVTRTAAAVAANTTAISTAGPAALSNTALASDASITQLPQPAPAAASLGATAMALATPPLPPLPRAPLRLVVPPRAEADVPMSEVERILAGGFWRVDEEPAGASRAAGGGGRSGARRAGGGGGGEGEEEGLSMYMRARMRQEEREAEEALQMLSYEPHDLKHILGSLKERTLERLGSLGRTIGETLSSGLHLGNLHLGNLHLGSLHLGGAASGAGGGSASASNTNSRSVVHGSQGQGQAHNGQWHWPGAGGSSGGQQQQQQQGQARSLPRVGRWGGGGGGAAAAGGGRPRLYCAAPAPAVSTSFFNSNANHTNGGGFGGAGEWSLRVPLLTVVDAEGVAHTSEVDPNGVAIPIQVNMQRYRSRSHVTRMSF